MSARALVVGTLAVALGGCSGRFIDDYAAVDGGLDSDATLDAFADGAVDAGADTGDVDYDGWWRRFDAPVHPGTYPPSGSYSPGNGFCPEVVCGPNATCDVTSGWCCSGRWVDDTCRCGDAPGCAQPTVCCLVTGVATCLAIEDCPGAH